MPAVQKSAMLRQRKGLAVYMRFITNRLQFMAAEHAVVVGGVPKHHPPSSSNYSGSVSWGSLQGLNFFGRPQAFPQSLHTTSVLLFWHAFGLLLLTKGYQNPNWHEINLVGHSQVSPICTREEKRGQD
jgi:hypothetical protein